MGLLTASSTSNSVSTDDVHWSLCDVESLIAYEHEGVVVDVAIGTEVLTSTADHPYWLVSGASLELHPVVSEVESKDPPFDMTNDTAGGLVALSRGDLLGHEAYPEAQELEEPKLCFDQRDYQTRST